jgi:putative ABC transport system substrate-binding protein
VIAAALGLAVLLTLLAVVGVGSAQAPDRPSRVAYLDLAKESDPPPELPAFADELRALGYEEGKTITIDYHWGENDQELLRARARKIVASDVDVIVAFGTQASQIAKQATCEKRIPVVSSGSDPVGSGVVRSLKRPGEWDPGEPRPPATSLCDDTGQEWNVTGLASGAKELAGKRLELLKQLVPEARRVAVLWNPSNSGDWGERLETEAAAHQLGIDPIWLGVTSASDIPAAFQEAQRQRAEALAAFNSTILNSNSARIVDCAAAARLPAIYSVQVYTNRGGLMSYGPDFVERYRRAAVFVDKLLQGARPGELSIEKAQRFQLVVNSATATSLGLTIPRSILVQVNQVVTQPATASC